MLWSFLGNWRVLAALAAVAVFIGLLAGAYFKGKSVERVAWNQWKAEAELKATQAARQVEEAKRNELEQVSKGYEEKIRQVHVGYAAWVDSERLERLRIAKRPCGDMPQTAPASGKSDAAASGTGNGSGTVDFRGIGTEIIGLARDLDVCREQVFSLQDLVKSYSEQK